MPCVLSFFFFLLLLLPLLFLCHLLFFLPQSSTPLCVGDMTVHHSLVLLYHPWDREVTTPEHTFYDHTQSTKWWTKFQGAA